MNARGPIHGLTMARGIAAWMVVLFHIRSGMPWLPDGIMAVVDKGYLAVDFFFLLSGFVIYLSAHQAFAERGLAAAPAFFGRRMARIYPLYAVMLALTVLFVALLDMTGRDVSGYPWHELPLHIVMLQNWGFTDALTWNHPAWSISTEFAAYLLFPVLVLALPLGRMPRWMLTGGIAGLIAVMAAWLHAAGLRNLGEDIPRFGLVRCLFEFSAGCLLCALWLQADESPRRYARWPLAVIASSSALLWSIAPANELWAFPVIASCTILLIAFASRGRSERGAPCLRWLIYTGEISYSTYLSHFMLFIWFKIIFVNDATNIAPSQIALFLTLAFLMSVLLYHGVEKPGRALGPSRFTRRAEAPL